MSLVIQRFGYKPLKQVMDVLVRLIARALPPLHAEQVYRVALPTTAYTYALPLNLEQLSVSIQKIYKNIFRAETAGVFVLKNVSVSWQGAVFKNLRLFSPTLHPGTEDEYKDTFLLKQWSDDSVQLPAGVDTIALVYNQYSSVNYYHWIIETLPRLLALREKYPQCLLLLPQGAPEYMCTSATIFGFEQVFELDRQKFLKASNLVIPYATPSHWGLPFGYEEGGVVNQIRREVVAHLQLPVIMPTRRLYISRSRAGARRLLNEQAVQELVIKYGFEVVHFEGMGFNQQVAMMQGVAVLLGVHGANLTNLIFMQPGAKIIEIMSEEINNLTYYRLATYLSIGYYSLPYKIVPSEAEVLFSDVIADINKLQEILIRL